MNIQAKYRHLGFTLIELLITVLIVAILAAIAYPSYMDSVQKSRRTTARNALLDLASREAKFYSTNNTYSASMATDLGYASAGPIAVPDATSHYYDLNVVTVVSGGIVTGFVATATATGSQATDSCGDYTLDNLNTKGAAQNNCW